MNLSIIVPIYKVEKYLKRCIESVISQNFSDYELILVDDGSPDECPKLCDDYARAYANISVIHKENGGLSDARNAGLAVSEGDYCIFLDSDDYITGNSLQLIAEAIDEYNKPDILRCKHITIDDETEEILFSSVNRVKEECIFDGYSFLKTELKYEFPIAAWTNVYRREFLLNNSLWFKKGILHEDVEFTPRVFLHAKTVVSLPIVFYVYRVRMGSITTGANKRKNALHILDICSELEKAFITVEDEDLRCQLGNFLAKQTLSAYHMGRLYKRRDYHFLDNDFLKRNAYDKFTRNKVRLFCISRKLYMIINIVYTRFAK